MKYILILLLLFAISCKTQDRQVSKIDKDADRFNGNIIAYQGKDIKTDNDRYQAVLRSLKNDQAIVFYKGEEYPLDKADSIINVLNGNCTITIIADTVKNVKHLKIEEK